MQPIQLSAASIRKRPVAVLAGFLLLSASLVVMAAPQASTTATTANGDCMSSHPAHAGTSASSATPMSECGMGKHDMPHKKDTKHGGMKHGGMKQDRMNMKAMKPEGMPAMGAMPQHDMSMHHGAMKTSTAPPIGSLPRSDGSAPEPYAAYGVTLHMPNDPLLAKFQLDNLETVHGREGNSQAWDLKAWTGHNLNRLWLRSEGTRSKGRIEEGDAELLWGHAISPFWDLMLGARHDLGPGPARNWAAFGIQGIAPYQFDYETTVYLGPNGRSALRIRATQEWLFTQRLILEPEIELNGYGKADPARGLGSGLSDSTLSLRLRYEFSRKFAPYVGVAWARTWGGTANLARSEGKPVFDRRVMLGLRVWY